MRIMPRVHFSAFIDNCIKFTCHLFLQDGSTPLMCAAQNGHNEAVKILVQHGAGVDTQDAVSAVS